MADRGMTPSQFGLRVRTHPAGLVITAANKMRNGTTMSVSYAGAISETISFDRKRDLIRANYERYDRFLRALPGKPRVENQNRIWRGIAGGEVADLLAELDVHGSSRKARGDLLARYIRLQIPNGGLTEWTIVLVSNPGDPTSEIGGYAARSVQRSQHPKDSRDREAVYRIRRLVSPTDELTDLTEDQRNRARDMTIQFFRDNQGGTRYQSEPTRAGGPFIRQVRDSSNGLLLIYPLEEENSAGVPFIGFATSFPTSEHDTPIEYVVNTVYWQEEFEE